MPGPSLLRWLLWSAALLAAAWLAAWLLLPRASPAVHLLLVAAFALLVAWGARRAGPTQRLRRR